MSTNPYIQGPAPQLQQPPQFNSGWPPAQSQDQQTAIGAAGVPPTGTTTGQMPSPLAQPSQEMVNGNYQQQLSSSMHGLHINAMKQPMSTGLYPTPGIGAQVSSSVPPPATAVNSQSGIISNGPRPGLTTTPISVPLTSVINNNLPAPPGNFANGELAMPPTSMDQTSSLQSSEQQNMQSMFPPSSLPQATQQPLASPALITGSMPPTSMSALPPSQSVAGGMNQMSKNSANIPGLPVMPPPITSSNAPQFISLMPGQQVPSSSMPASQATMGGVFPPTTGAQPFSNQLPRDQSGGVYQPKQHQPQQPVQQQGNVMSMPPQTAPLMTPTPNQVAAMSHMAGQPPLSGQAGQSAMQGQMSMPRLPHMSGQPPMPGQMFMPGQPPMAGHPPMAGQPSMPGQPPVPQQPPMLGQPPLPGQHAMTGQPPMLGQAPMSGQPPMPGQPPMQGQYGQTFNQGPPAMSAYQQQPGRMQGGWMPGEQMTQPPGMYQQQPAQRRLDPDQMPNPMQVMMENQRTSGGPFVTNQAGLVPPLVTTKFVVHDQGNSSPRFVRSSLYCIPTTADLLKNTAIPFTLIVSPLANTIDGEYDPPIVDFGQIGPIRCNRCKAYMSAHMQFIDAGRRFQCLLCKVSTEVPTEYFQHLDHTGQRVDKYERPELVLGTYEFLATKDYCRNNVPPEIPAFIFVIDVSYNTMKSGLVHLLCSQVKRIIKHLPVDKGQEKSKMRVGFITYNNCVHFYNIKSSLAQPQMMVVGDVHDMFMPLLDGFLCHPDESEAVIDALMEQIPKMFVNTKETETILYPAIQAGLEALKASNCAGKLLVFHSTLPTGDAPGKLKIRDERKLLGTEKEKTVLSPQNMAYNTLGHECVEAGCSVDLFLFNNAYIDIATIGQVARLTGGEIYKYTYFQADTDGKRLIEDIVKNVSRPIAFDAVMRLRTSTGVRATDFYGHFFMTNTTDVEFASVDCNKSVAIEIKHDDKLSADENVYLQVALLYTSCAGQRRLRIHNLALRTTATIVDVFKSCDLDAIMLFFAKQSCVKLLELTPKAVKDNLMHRSAQSLACYRKHCTSPTSAGQLILPECLKLLPLYISCLIKNDAISGGSDMTLDDRSHVIHFVLSMDLNTSVNYLYPRFIPIHNVDADATELPMAIRCTHEKMSEDGAYILENGVHLFIWLGQSLPQSFIQSLFGVQCTQQVNAERFAIVGETPLAHRVRHILDMIIAERPRCMRVTCVRQNDKLETVFRHFLIEDRGTDGSASYVDFLCHMHKEIKDLLS